MQIYSNNLIFIEIHESEVPWLKIFTTVKRKEFSECTQDEKNAIWNALDSIEKVMLVPLPQTKTKMD
ncbi:MAG: hypothetical protein U9R50_02130 [Campylobacterota bacterium]|nr:hypothetical protein [Campylobacterota bacterium]